jgi:hypothetical protein
MNKSTQKGKIICHFIDVYFVSANQIRDYDRWVSVAKASVTNEVYMYCITLFIVIQETSDNER